MSLFFEVLKIGHKKKKKSRVKSNSLGPPIETFA